MKRIASLTFSLILSIFALNGYAADVIKVDGSSTVFPITEAVAEDFGAQGGSKVMVGISGTGGGFKRFCRGETDISDASRPIKASEVTACKEGGVEYIELPVAYDGLAVITNPQNDWVDYLTVAELKKIWDADAQGVVMKWNQVRSSFPDEEIRLFGPGTDSGTFDYFTEAINGKSGKSRGDYTASEDDNVLVEGVASAKGGLGYFGLAYYQQNKDRLKLIPVDDETDSNGTGPIAPSMDTVINATYQPLARPIFIYVNANAAKKESVAKFVEFYLAHAKNLVEEVGYIPLPDEAYEAALARFSNTIKGTVFAKALPGIGIVEKIRMQK